MKNLILIILLCGSFPLFSQTFSTLEKEFNFEKETEEKEISFPTHTGTMDISFGLGSEISKGELKVLIFDPNGKKEGGFHLEALSGVKADFNIDKTGNKSKENQTISYTITEDGDSNSRGSMSKSINKPISGTWRVKIIATKLSGALAVKIKQVVQD